MLKKKTKQNKTKQNNNEQKTVCSEIRKIEKITKQEKASKQEFLVSILCFDFFVNPVQIQCPSQYINQALLLIIRFSKY